MNEPIGLPQFSDRNPRSAPSFPGIPDLRDLLPNGGLAGIVYAQVTTNHTREAQEIGLRPIKHTEVFTIQGPTGTVSVILTGKGTPIPGASPDAGARECVLDGDIFVRTGLPVPDRMTEYVFWFGPPPEGFATEESTDGSEIPVTQGADAQRSQDQERTAGAVPAVQRKPVVGGAKTQAGG